MSNYRKKRKRESNILSDKTNIPLISNFDDLKYIPSNTDVLLDLSTLNYSKKKCIRFSKDGWGIIRNLP